MTKIDDLIAAGEKATQGEWSFDWIYAVLRYASKSGFDPDISDGLAQCDYYGGEDPSFIVKAANAREDIKAMRDENKRLREALVVADRALEKAGIDLSGWELANAKSVVQQALGDKRDD